MFQVCLLIKKKEMLTKKFGNNIIKYMKANKKN